MKKNIVLLFTCSSILLFTNCFKKANPTAQKTPTEEAEYSKTHYTEAQRALGKTIFENSCAECHDLPVPGERNISEWDDILPKMFKKSKLSYDDAGLVKAYLVYNAKGNNQ